MINETRRRDIEALKSIAITLCWGIFAAGSVGLLLGFTRPWESDGQRLVGLAAVVFVILLTLVGLTMESRRYGARSALRGSETPDPYPSEVDDL